MSFRLVFQLEELIVVEHDEKRTGKARKEKINMALVCRSETTLSRVSATAVKPLSTNASVSASRLRYTQLLRSAHA